MYLFLISFFLFCILCQEKKAERRTEKGIAIINGATSATSGDKTEVSD